MPSEDIGVVVLANGPALDADKIVDRILAILLPPYDANLRGQRPVPTITATLSASPPPLDWRIGTWRGEIRTYDQPRALAVRIENGNRGSVQIGDRAPVPIDRCRVLKNDGIVLRAKAQLGTTDAESRQPYTLGFELYRDADQLYGCATTWSQPGARDGGLFSYFVNLKREP